MRKVLFLTHSGDLYNIDRVQEALHDRGVEGLRMDTDLFPTGMKISEWVDHSGSKVCFTIKGQEYEKEQIGAVWLRKIWEPRQDLEMEQKYREASVKESVAVRTAFFKSFENVPWLDTIPAIQKASDKYYQLRVAQSVGLKIPKTIISNDPSAVKRFYNALKGEMVAKLHTPLSFGMKTDDFFLYTTKISREDLDDLDMLAYCPMIFQELIPKAYELRIAYIDGHCFTGRLNTADVMDWRKSDPELVKWQSYEITKELQHQLTLLMNEIGLSFGAIDLIRQTDGQYVFLEVNPIGEWGMLEKELNLPISKFIAEGLINRMK